MVKCEAESPGEAKNKITNQKPYWILGVIIYKEFRIPFRNKNILQVKTYFFLYYFKRKILFFLQVENIINFLPCVSNRGANVIEPKKLPKTKGVMYKGTFKKKLS